MFSFSVIPMFFVMCRVFVLVSESYHYFTYSLYQFLETIKAVSIDRIYILMIRREYG